MEFLHSFRIQYSSHFFREENALLFVENRFVFSHHSHLDKNKFPFKFLSIDSIRNWELIIIKKFDSIFVYFFFQERINEEYKDSSPHNAETVICFDIHHDQWIFDEYQQTCGRQYFILPAVSKIDLVCNVDVT